MIPWIIVGGLAAYGLYKLASEKDDDDYCDDDDGYYESSSQQQAQAAAQAAQNRALRALVDQARSHAEAVQSDFDSFEKMFESLRTSLNNSQLFDLEKQSDRRLRRVMYRMITNPEFLRDHSYDQDDKRWVRLTRSFIEASNLDFEVTELGKIMFNDLEVICTSLNTIDEVITSTEALEQMLEGMIADYEAGRRS